MTRGRSRRAPSGTLLRSCLVVTATLLALSAVTPVTSFTTGGTGRGPSAAIVDDADGALGIDNATAVHTGSTCRLVTVANRLDQPVDVTVALRADSEGYGSLVVGGVTQGNATTVALASGDSQAFDLEVDADGSLDGETVYYHVTADGESVDVTANDRETPIDNGSTAECG